MFIVRILVFVLLVWGSQSMEYKFPENFKFGAASSAYQVEGAWNVGDKSENIWDYLLHKRPELVVDGTNGDITCDSYHFWQRDIEMAEELGLDMYRFSIAWSRLLPTGFSNIISEDGKRYYSNLIDGLLRKGIEPVVTLHHFDLPQSIQDLGGWANPLIADWFSDYAEAVFSLFADRVKIWVTINEPIGVCEGGYHKLIAPYFEDLMLGRYLCNKNVLIAHAKAYRMYNERYKPKYHGKVSLANLFFWFEPETAEDVELTELAIEFWEGRYAYPIFSKEGGWPKKVEALLLKNGIKEGYPYPRLPPFTPEEIALIKGTYDFYGLNHYTTRLVRKVKAGETPGNWLYYGSEELNMSMVSHPSWKSSDVDWFSIYPEGLGKQLRWLNTTYDVKEIIILENGIPTSDPGLVDPVKLEYIRDNLVQVCLAIKDGIPITGYTVWTIMDNFEWFGGYSMKFGLYAVNFNSSNRNRTPRESARFYSKVVKSRTVHTIEDDLNIIL